MYMITTPLDEPSKPGFTRLPIPGVIADVVDRQGEPVPEGQEGLLVLKRPWPQILRAGYSNNEHYRRYCDLIRDFTRPRILR